MEGQHLKARCVTEIEVGVRVTRHRHQLRQAHIELRIRQCTDVGLKLVYCLLKLRSREGREEIPVQVRQLGGDKTQVLRPAIDSGRLCVQIQRREGPGRRNRIPSIVLRTCRVLLPSNSPG